MADKSPYDQPGHKPSSGSAQRSPLDSPDAFVRDEARIAEMTNKRRKRKEYTKLARDKRLGKYGPEHSPDDGPEPGGDRATEDEVKKVGGKTSADKKGDKQDSEESEQSEGNTSTTVKKQSRISRSKSILGGGLATMLVGGTIGIFSIGQGPLQLIHAGQLLQQFHFSNDENFMDGRAGKILIWMRTRNAPERRNLSWFGNKLADRYTGRLLEAGMEPHYNRGAISAITFITGEPRARETLDALRAREDLDIDIPDPDANGRIRLELPQGFGTTKLRRGVLKAAVGNVFGKISSAMPKRLLTLRSQVDFTPKNIARRADESIFEYIDRSREARKQKREQGKIDSDTDFTGEDDEDAEGRRTPNDINDEAARGAAEALDGDTPSLRGQLTDAFSKGLGIATAATLLCSLDQLGDAVPDLRQANLVLPLMRLSMEIIIEANKVMAGKGNLDHIGAILSDFYDATAGPGAQSVFSSKTFQAALGQPQTGLDMADSNKPDISRPAFFQVLNTITSATGISQVCGFVTSTAGGWVVDIADWATSGGPAQAIVAAVTDTLSGVALQGFIDDIVSWMGGEVAKCNPGADIGNCMMYGGGLGANEAAISHGAEMLAPRQARALRAESEAIARAEFRQKSAYDRYLNPYETRSLVGKAMIQNPELMSPSGFATSFLSSPLKTFSGLFSNVASVLAPKASAAPGDYDYGFPEFGFSAEDQDNPRYEDPFVNAERVEPHLDEYNERFGDCFGTVIDPETYEIITKTRDNGIRYDLIQDGLNNDEGNFEECNDHSQALDDYRFYLADQFTAKAMACYENLDLKACEEITKGVAEGADDAAGGGGNATNIGGCPDHPVQTNMTREVTGGGVTIRVNNCIAGNIARLLRDAAGAGINFAGSSGWRSPDRQIELRIAHCGSSQYAIYEMPSSQCSPPTARPGRSNHEAGTAIDFACGGGGSVSHGDACWNWLVAHAAQYGLENLPSEAWHWSIDGT